MPSRPHDPRRPSIYLDTSTLSYAFKAAQVGVGNDLVSARDLFSLVESVARSDNLVFSLFHLIEIAANADPTDALAMLSWLDGLPLVWARSLEHVHDDEDEYCLKVVAGCEAPAPVRAFAPSMIATFESMSVTDSVDFLGAARLPEVFDKIRHAPSLAARMKERAARTAVTFHQNRAEFAPPGTPADEVAQLEDGVRQRHLTDLRRRALAAHNRLVGRMDSEYLSLGRTLNDVVVPFSELFFSRPTSFPVSRIENGMNQGFIGTASRRDPGSKRFGRLESSFADQFHAQCAAYCEVLTCDRLTSEWLGDIRRELGLQTEVVFEGGDFSRFIRDLNSAVDLASRSFDGDGEGVHESER